MSEKIIQLIVLGFSAPMLSNSEASIRKKLDPVFATGTNPIFYDEDGNIIGTYIFGADQSMSRIITVLGIAISGSGVTDGVVWAALYAKGSDVPTDFLIKTAVDKSLHEVSYAEFAMVAAAGIGV